MKSSDGQSDTYDLAEPTSPPPTTGDTQAVPLFTRNRYCRDCGYNLRGVTEPQCPECGRPFQPQNERTVDRFPPMPKRRALPSLVWRVVSIIVIYGIWRLAFEWFIPELWCFAIVLFPVWVSLLAYQVLTLIPLSLIDNLPAHLLTAMVIGALTTATLLPDSLILAVGAIAAIPAGLIRRHHTVA